MTPEHWTRLALHPPQAHGVPLRHADLRSRPEDFHVEEELSFVPDGAAAHWLLRVEKRGANTQWVAGELARAGGLRPGDVGYAGLKDRHAVTVQWFSVPAHPKTAGFWRDLRAAEFSVIEVAANARKLKRGALSGNRFRIRLRNAAWSAEALDAKLDAIRRRGVPNYFGPQRFGRQGANLERVAAWAQGGRGPRGRTERGFILSAARSLIFNAALAERVTADSWATLLPGDLASLEGSGSHFAVGEVDEAIESRLAAFDIHPSGPLWGDGTPATTGTPAYIEARAAAHFDGVASLLAAQGLVHERRTLRCVVRDLAVETADDGVVLRFGLGRGQFATSVLREICELDAPADF